MMTWLKSSLRNWLLASVGLAMAVVCITAVIAVVRLNTSIGDYERLLTRYVHAETEILATNRLFKQQVQEWKNVLLRGSDDAQREKYWRQFREAESEVQSRIEDLIAGAPTPAIRSTLQKFLTAHENMAEEYRQGYKAFVDSGFDHRAGDTAVRGIDRGPTELLSKAADQIGTLTRQQREAASRTAGIATDWSLPVIVGVSIVALALLFWMLNRSVVHPTRRLADAIDAYSHGDFRNDTGVDRADELGRLSEGLKGMRSNITDMLARMQEAARSLAETAQELTRTASGLADDSSEVRSRTEGSASSISEMSATIQEVARNASDAASAADQAGDNTQSSLRAMDENVTAVKHMDDLVSELGNAMEQLQQDTTEIGTVLEVIRGIAEQTNLLALNAAIESARAGEHGRGFAVVAEEVRTLAQRTQESTEEIRQTIEKLQSAATTAGDLTRKGRERAGSTLEQAESTATAIRDVETAVSTMRDLNLQIATATEEQSTVSEDINRTITEVAELTSRSDEGAQGISHAAGELDSLSRRLDEMFRRFRIA
ncbi:methyl-accepting chemotaxis protein [Arhodomonas aquaeolei]|uniref:methyl-accepting chemotaxis protein n=1 Tax=Arhodomonas aquaeolei TaxID=2369 RepID=UPI0021672227|nr:methyl-accepting chemotaxis protein [Arhodomonas aquaeolei]MCS4505209.1 methyl-accepting chemotaxis protein [Arhodomonas aquaeolei]